jgi:inorganic triphosphatase YgiF
MGQELEFKLAVPQPMLLEKILFDPVVTQVRQGDYCLLNMSTTYYDTPDRALRQRHWALRLRQENDRPVATLKTPGQGHARGEWSCEAPSIEAALEPLMVQGAPAELADLTAGKPLNMVCAARFSRRAADLVFADGTVCELAGDVGELLGGREREALCEVELELKSGSEETVAAFARELMERFGLQEESRSKFARAAALAD